MGTVGPVLTAAALIGGDSRRIHDAATMLSSAIEGHPAHKTRICIYPRFRSGQLVTGNGAMVSQ